MNILAVSARFTVGFQTKKVIYGPATSEENGLDVLKNVVAENGASEFSWGWE